MVGCGGWQPGARHGSLVVSHLSVSRSILCCVVSSLQALGRSDVVDTNCHQLYYCSSSLGPDNSWLPGTNQLWHFQIETGPVLPSPVKLTVRPVSQPVSGSLWKSLEVSGSLLSLFLVIAISGWDGSSRGQGRTGKPHWTGLDNGAWFLFEDVSQSCQQDPSPHCRDQPGKCLPSSWRMKYEFSPVRVLSLNYQTISTQWRNQVRSLTGSPNL